MKILMFGWEYPPKFNGGLGVASEGLAKGLAKEHQVHFVLPKVDREAPSGGSIKLHDASKVNDEELWAKVVKYRINYYEVDAKLYPYVDPRHILKKREASISKREEKATSHLRNVKLTGEYGQNIMAEVSKYAILSSELSKSLDFDIIHAHDWMSILAGLMAKEVSNKPLIVHIHSTEIDRNGIHVNPEIVKIEKEGLLKSDGVFAVSNKVKNDLINFYGIKADKIKVIPNAVAEDKFVFHKNGRSSGKIGFLGRLVHQKGPLRFLDIIKEISMFQSEVEFIIAGDGYQKDEINTAINKLNFSDKVVLKGFLDRTEVEELFRELDIIVLPSISEPFGLVALEAAKAGVAVVISENSGILEYLPLIKVPQWNTYLFASEIRKLMEDEAYRNDYIQKCSQATRGLSWDHSCELVNKEYKALIG